MNDKPTYTAAELEAAKFAPLTAEPASEHARATCDQFAAMLFHQSNRRPNKARRNALAALVADLLEREAQDQGRWLYRPTAAGSFTDGRVGYRPFMHILNALEAARMIEVVTGNRVWTQSDFTGGKKVPVRQRATRFRPSDWLRRWFADQGITRENWAEHFARNEATIPSGFKSVTLRATKPKNAKPGAKGRPMHVAAKDPVYEALTARMDRLNGYLAQQSFSPFNPVYLRRIFANGDDPAFAWNLGGRIYALGTESYQRVKKGARTEIAINGKPTKEIDVQASHLTILVGLGHLPRTILDGDPYEIEGLPRDIVKQWVTMTIGHGKRHKRWPQGVSAKYEADNGRKLARDYPLRKTGDLILTKLPLIKDDGLTASAAWAELQFRESEVLLSVMETLAYDHDCPSLPVHDSLIIPEQALALATRTLEDVFHAQLQIAPTIT